MMSFGNGTKSSYQFSILTSTALSYMSLNSQDWTENDVFSSVPNTVSDSAINVTLENNGFPYWDQPPSGQNAVAMVLLVLILMVIIVGTIVGNILVCVAVCLVRKLRRPYNYLLVSLAVSDLCVAILVMPMALLHELLGKWQFGRMACDVWVSFDVLSCTASILNLCMISVDRYLAITRPLEYGVKRTPRRMVAYIVFVWLGAAFVSVPPVLILGNEHGDGSICQVCQNFWYQIYATFGSFYIPLTVMVIVYLKIFQAAQRIVNEEKKAQAHMKFVEEQGKSSRTVISNPAPSIIKDNQCGKSKEAQKLSSRCSIVQINNGEVETKLASYSPPDGTSEAEWTPNSTNKLLQKNMNYTNHQRQLGSPLSNDHKSDKNIDESQLLEVPAIDGRLLGSVSPVSTTTTCESSWSINQLNRDDRSEIVSLTLNPSYDDAKILVPESSECQIITKENKNLLNRTTFMPDKNQRFSEKCQGELQSLANDKNVMSCTVIVNTLREDSKDESLEPSEMAAEEGISLPYHSQPERMNASDASSHAALLGKPTDIRRQSSIGNNSPKKKYPGPPKSKLRITLAKERKASTTLGIIMSAFIVCWLPFFVLAIVRPFLSDPTAIPNSISSLFLWLGYANSLLNPIIYATLNKDFRKPFQEILCLRCSSLNLLMREEFYHSQYGPDTPNHSHMRYSGTHRDQLENFSPTNYDTKTQADIISESRF